DYYCSSYSGDNTFLF
nr:immunoglobulin light chain junction region [Macaca mulatta]